MIPPTSPSGLLMDNSAELLKVFRFGLFEADSCGGTLTRNGVRVKIQDQPFRLLLLLLERAGEVVTRDELRQKLWPEGTYVDFDGSLNVILKRLRAAIDDDPDNPRFIETVPRRGYRFIAPVSVVKDSTFESLKLELSRQSPPVETLKQTEASSKAGNSVPGQNGGHWSSFLIYSLTAASFLLAVALAWLALQSGPAKAFGRRLSFSRKTSARKSVALLGFQNLSGRPEDAWLGTAVSEMLSTELAGGDNLRLVSGEDVANLRLSSPWSPSGTLDSDTTARLGTALNSDVLVLGSYVNIGTKDQGQLRLDVRLQDAKTGEVMADVAEVGSTQDLFRLVSRIGAQLRNRLGVEPLQGSAEAGVLAALPLDPEAAKFYALGVSKLREFDVLAAKDLMQQAAEVDPKFSLVHAMLARAWAQLGYEQKRQQEAKTAFDLSTDLPRAQRLLVEGEYYESLGRQEQAASVYRALYELFPDNLEYGLRLAAVLNLSGHGSQAMEVVGRLRGMAPPSSGDPRIDLAESRAMKDDKPVELSLARSAMRKASDRGQRLIYALARKEECMVLLYSEQPDLGPASCEDAYNIFLSAGNRPAAADAVRLMADGIGAHGHFQQAIETYQRALTLVEGTGEHLKTGAILNNMAINFANQGKLDRAEDLYEQAKLHFEQAGDMPNRSAAMVNIADIHFMRGKLALAEQSYRKTLEFMATIDHSDPGYTLYRLADLQLAEGNVREALRLAQEAIDSIRPSQGGYQYLTNAMVELGAVLEANGDTGSARDQFQQALAIQEKTGALDLAAETKVELAQLAIAEKRPEEAVSLLHDSMAEFEKEKSGPELSGAYTLLSRALLMENNLHDAREAAHRGAEFTHAGSDPALKLTSEIQQARLEMSATEDAGNSSSGLKRLHSVIADAHKLGYYSIECEARLALGESELKLNSSLGHKHLAALVSETRTRGMELLARQAEGAMASGTVVALNHAAQ